MTVKFKLLETQTHNEDQFTLKDVKLLCCCIQKWLILFLNNLENVIIQSRNSESKCEEFMELIYIAYHFFEASFAQLKDAIAEFKTFDRKGNFS
jgi:alpha/beta superfamily hydrolase